jgi:hypothetical protein
MKRLSIYIFVSIIFCSCSIFESRIVGILPQPTSKQEAEWNKICGKWYSQSLTKDNETREELCERYADGTFVNEFKTTDRYGNVTIQTESGEWGISGNIYFTIIKVITLNGIHEQVDVLSPYYRDAYKVKSLTDKKMVYKHITMKDVYKDIKVDKRFELKK